MKCLSEQKTQIHIYTSALKCFSLIGGAQQNELERPYNYCHVSGTKKLLSQESKEAANRPHLNGNKREICWWIKSWIAVLLVWTSSTEIPHTSFPFHCESLWRFALQISNTFLQSPWCVRAISPLQLTKYINCVMFLYFGFPLKLFFIYWIYVNTCTHIYLSIYLYIYMYAYTHVHVYIYVFYFYFSLYTLNSKVDWKE